jgi:hypothetical protein
MRGKKRTALPCLEALALQNGPECLGRHDTTLIRSATLTPRTAHARTSWRRAKPGTAKVANCYLACPDIRKRAKLSFAWSFGELQPQYESPSCRPALLKERHSQLPSR